MILVRDVYNYLNDLAPFSMQAGYDNSGLVVGNAYYGVKTVLTALDITNDIISDAEELASMTDASVVVVRENFAEVSDITNAAKLLSSGGPVLGCVFNGARRTEITADAARARGGLYVG